MKRAILPFILVAICTTLNGQFYKRFNLEIGLNRSKNINVSSFFPESHPHYGAYRGAPRNESASYSNNYNLSLGIQIVKNHHFRLRYSRNTLGSHLTGSFANFGWCGVGGGTSATILENAFNQVRNKTFGFVYEYQIPIQFGRLILGLGAEKHWNNFDDTIVYLQNYQEKNYALHFSAGYSVPLWKCIDLLPKLFVTRALRDTSSEFYQYIDSETELPEYIPIQLGIEMGIRLSLN